MLNRHRLAEAAGRAGVPVTRQLKTRVDGWLVVLELPRDPRDLRDELEGLGHWPPPAGDTA